MTGKTRKPVTIEVTKPFQAPGGKVFDVGFYQGVEQHNVITLGGGHDVTQAATYWVTVPTMGDQQFEVTDAIRLGAAKVLSIEADENNP
jgi:hypothetical protein